MSKRDEIREQIYEIVSDDRLIYKQIVERIINLPSIAVVNRKAERTILNPTIYQTGNFQNDFYVEVPEEWVMEEEVR